MGKATAQEALAVHIYVLEAACKSTPAVLAAFAAAAAVAGLL